MKEHIKIENCFSKIECNNIIKKYKDQKWAPHEWSHKQGNSLINLEKNKKLFPKNHKDFLIQLLKEEDNLFIVYKVKYFLQSYIKNYDESYQMIKKLSTIRLNKYPIGSQMLPHVDHITTLFDGKERGIPIISIVGLLNDNFKGGEFSICGENTNLKQGDVLVFPSMFLFPHEVKKIIKGTRYSFVLWGY